METLRELLARRLPRIAVIQRRSPAREELADPGVLDEWCKELEGLDPVAVDAALTEFCSASPFWPAPADVLGIVAQGLRAQCRDSEPETVDIDETRHFWEQLKAERPHVFEAMRDLMGGRGAPLKKLQGGS